MQQQLAGEILVVGAILRQALDGRGIGSRVIEGWHTALLAHADPFLALDLAFGLHFVVEE